MLPALSVHEIKGAQVAAVARVDRYLTTPLPEAAKSDGHRLATATELHPQKAVR
ncbi:MAG: hypothetical protein NVSMB64_18550 [Candidatus Velthaea sp.]